MNRLFALALLATPALAPSMAYGQYVGTDDYPFTSTVTEARVQRDEQPVVLQGTLVAKVGHERYRFRDATGEIEVEIDDDEMPQHRTIDASTQVELHGEVDKHRFKPTDIDVDHVHVMSAR
ncbi:stress-induced protein YgiW [Stenotrophomonas maltophilia]|uniref:YgiW/YdeI family stress tolerance OB fold protein n=1 Tax=Stenotrophomonas TaxID=40323 RepID=UPI000DA8963C|nr:MULTISPECIES: NirD/YgiW/YdeI family stress tolerance protein [Stenotrophomonas]MCV0220537.1 NirD/YgiW/YdeI family stress tolerance protein [Stenotrophomonas sp. Ps181]PZS83835.1 stress-induced protein YgiW [Stenotrophomonas maltophilia]PZT11043.1 stress-induced protein YgiW [Stenotrophomonas maltophilia]HDS1216915.1 NirD/YgiW/YdeI family stress tolerance protein [Stenotrophomonas maltophilia]